MIGALFNGPNLLVLGVFLLSSGILYLIYLKIIEERKIQALGGHAPRRFSWIFGIDSTIEGATALAKKDNLRWWTETIAKYSNPENPHTFEFKVLARRIIFTTDPDNIKAVLATQFQDFGKGERFNYEWHPFLGDSIFSTDGQKWHDSRQLIRPQFIKDRVADLRTFEQHVQLLLPQLRGNGQTVDVADLFFKFTLDTATHFLLGRSVDALVQPKVRFADAFGKVQHIQALISTLGVFGGLIPRHEYYQGIKVINEFIEPYIEEALSLSPEELEKKTKSDDGYTFLHAIAAYTRDRKVIRDQILAILLAGRDTTAATLSFLFYRLSTKPNVVQKIRDEIMQVVGPHRAPTYEDLKSMRYINHCLNETLRLYPSVPGNVRFSLKDTTLPSGGGADGKQPFGVLKGSPVVYFPLALHRREDIYPPVSSGFPAIEDFEPERWDHWTPKPWTYIPFNGGPRICVGQQFALSEMAYTVTRIFQRFARVENRMGEHKMGFKTDVILVPDLPVKVAFFEGETEKSAL